jgi:hypothetical protein
MTDQNVAEFFGSSSPSLMKKRVWSPNDMDWGRAMFCCADRPVSNAPPVTAIQHSQLHRIPNTIHFIWLGRNELPFRGTSDWNKPMISWHKRHADFQIQLWTDRSISNEHWRNEAALKYALDREMYGMASDVLRLELLHKYGGIYVDVDYFCVDSVSDLLRGNAFVCGASNAGCVELNNGFMAATPGNVHVDRMMGRIQTWFATTMTTLPLMVSFLDKETAAALEKARHLTNDDVIAQTGPGLLTREIGSYLVSNDSDHAGILILNHAVLHPVPNYIRGDAALNAMDMYVVPGVTKAVHLWGCSWQHTDSAIYESG